MTLIIASTKQAFCLGGYYLRDYDLKIVLSDQRIVYVRLPRTSSSY